MHEQGIAREIIRQANAAAAVKGKRVTRIVVRVGDLGHLPADEMAGALRALVPWEVVLEREGAVVRCDCGFVGAPEILEKGHDHNVFRCPSCKELMPRIVSGEDILLVSVDAS